MNLPLGYRYAAVYAGIRKTSKEDLALIVSDRLAHAAAVFTTNRVQAAPVRLARKHLETSDGKAAAILVNAGNANCATRTGRQVALISCKAAGAALQTKAHYVLPASTGVIGVELDPALITQAMPKLTAALSPEKFDAVAEAILTTDTRAKTASEQVRLSRGAVRIAGMTKGAGMIHPNMATTLAFVMTDADLSAKELERMLAEATDQSFNCLTVDGDMSTNDTIVLLANGASKVKPGKQERKLVQDALNRILESLAKQIAADGEGARKLITVRADGFRTNADARRVARAIANSPLVKTAVGGSDPNWGRVLAAAGYSGVEFDPKNIDIQMQRVAVCRGGFAADFSEEDLKQRLNGNEVFVEIRHRGKHNGAARIFTCDLTEGYVEINGSYRT